MIRASSSEDAVTDILERRGFCTEDENTLKAAIAFKNSKLGILTNGIVYKFYSRHIDKKDELNPTPFLIFDLSNFDYNDISELVKFYRTSIDLKEIMEEAEEIYFLDKFEKLPCNHFVFPNFDILPVFLNLSFDSFFKLRLFFEI